MPRSRSGKTTTSRPVRFVKNTRPAGRRNGTSRRSARPAARPAEPTPAPNRRRTNGRLPGWSELEKNNRREGQRRTGGSVLLDSVPTVRLSLYILAAAVLVTLYVGHVHATRVLAERVVNLQEANLNLHLRYNQVKGAYDRATGPAIIHERARQLGLREALPNGYPVLLD